MYGLSLWRATSQAQCPEGFSTEYARLGMSTALNIPCKKLARTDYYVMEVGASIPRPHEKSVDPRQDSEILQIPCLFVTCYQCLGDWEPVSGHYYVTV